jgi:hypothetical protein
MGIRSYRPSNVPEYFLKDIPDAANVVRTMPFSFSSVFAALAAGVAVQNTIQTLADSDFVCISLQSDNVNVLPTVLIRDTTSSWPFMNTAVPVVSIFGTGSLPYFLPVPWFFKSKTTIELNVVASAIVATGFTLTMSGLRIFRS